MSPRDVWGLLEDPPFLPLSEQERRRRALEAGELDRMTNVRWTTYSFQAPPPFAPVPWERWFR